MKFCTLVFLTYCFRQKQSFVYFAFIDLRSEKHRGPALDEQSAVYLVFLNEELFHMDRYQSLMLRAQAGC